MIVYNVLAAKGYMPNVIHKTVRPVERIESMHATMAGVLLIVN